MSLVPEVFALALIVIAQFCLIWTLYRRLVETRAELRAERARRADEDASGG